MFAGNEIHKVLEALGAQLEEIDAPITNLVVIGGAALNCLGLIIRPTRDIDCLAILQEDSDNIRKLIAINELPSHITRAAAVIAEHFDLPGDWINAEPSAIAEGALPAGIEDRLESQEYGDRLVIYFISRFDQIHFKLYAAEQGPGRHADDLMALNPTGDEIEHAAGWCLLQDPSAGFKAILKDMLVKLGFEDVSKRI